jgi:hypothetical protein
VDDRTQVQLVSLKTEAQLLKAWMARRADVAQRRREGPVEALRHRVGLLEREVPRLEHEVAGLEQRAAKVAQPRPPLAVMVTGALRGAGLCVAAMAWVLGVVALTPNARIDEPVRLAAMGLVIGVVALGRR